METKQVTEYISIPQFETLKVCIRNDAVLSIEIVKKKKQSKVVKNSALSKKLKNEIIQYLQGSRKTFTIQTLIRGTTFQERVWSEIQKIPYGETLSYKDIARKINNPKSSRAVGAACGRCPTPILIPCHRVIYSNGSIGNYAFGKKLKTMLLKIESRHYNF